MVLFRPFFLALIFCLTLPGRADTLTTAAELYRVIYDRPTANVKFELTGTVLQDTQMQGSMLPLADESGAILLATDLIQGAPLAAGERVHVKGYTLHYNPQALFAIPHLSEVTRLGRGTPPEPPPVSSAQFYSGACDCRCVRITALVRSAVHDEIDPRYIYLLLATENDFIHASFPQPADGSFDIRGLIGRRIEAVGQCVPRTVSLRINIGRTLEIVRNRDIRILDPPEADPFKAPYLSALKTVRAADIARKGPHRTTGRVLATWDGNQLLLRQHNDNMSVVSLELPELPSYGDRIDVVGLPESDLFHLNLLHATWRPHAGKASPIEVQIHDIGISRILQTTNGITTLDANYHGQVLRFEGKVINPPDPERLEGEIIVESDNRLVNVKSPRNLPRSVLQAGATVRVTGVCVMKSATDEAKVFPRLTGFFIVPRVSEDLVVLARPPWWTPARLLAVLAAFFLALVGIFVWNRSLNRLASRRSRELVRAERRRFRAELRTEERTRLSVELHDTVAQNLTGIGLRIDAAERLADVDSDKMKRQLAIASRTLLSCREELRRCLWDLRSRALDEHTMEDAIRRTLQLQDENVKIILRFKVPRARLSDDTAHNVLRIVCELVTNAIRHGKATAIAIAGELDGDRLLFSIADNGCGFDPESSDGVALGHFGLQGIRERLRRYSGTLGFSTAPDGGTKARVEMDLTLDAMNGKS